MESFFQDKKTEAEHHVKLITEQNPNISKVDFRYRDLPQSMVTKGWRRISNTNLFAFFINGDKFSIMFISEEFSDVELAHKIIEISNESE